MGVFTDDSPQNDTPIRKTGVFTDGPRQIHAAVRKIGVFTDGPAERVSHQEVSNTATAGREESPCKESSSPQSVYLMT